MTGDQKLYAKLIAGCVLVVLCVVALGLDAEQSDGHVRGLHRERPSRGCGAHQGERPGRHKAALLNVREVYQRSGISKRHAARLRDGGDVCDARLEMTGFTVRLK